jgi:uncharacterized protein (DUF58 family)
VASLLVKVKTKMSIYSHEKVRGMLEGEYGSVFKGRSMDFDDLRAYIPGDDIKDIDWKATARSGQTLIKRYIAVRKHNILLVVDTGKNMAATATGGESKKDVAVMLAGVVGYLAQKHGDLVALVAGNSQHSVFMPLKGTNVHLERILQRVDKDISMDSAPSDITTQLEYIAKTMRRKMMLVIISDDVVLSEQHKNLLRRLRAQHEIMWLSVGDYSYGSLSDRPLQDVLSDSLLPQYIYRHKQVKQEFVRQEHDQLAIRTRTLDSLRIASHRVGSEKDVVTGVFTLLERQKHARR